MSDITEVVHGTAATGADSGDQVSVTAWNGGHTLVGVARVAQVDVTNAQLLDVHNNPVSIVPAPGVGKVVVPVSIHAAFKYGTHKFNYNGENYVTVGYDGGTTWNGIIAFLEITNDRQLPTFDLSGGPFGDVSNLPLTLSATNGAMVGGVGCTLRVWVSYLVLDLP